MLALPEVTLGQIPGSGGSQRVARIAGLTRAVDMMMLGRRIPAPEALAWGLLTRVVEDSAALDQEIDEMVAKLTSMSPLALKTVKRVLTTAYDAGLGVGLEVEGHAYEKLRRNRGLQGRHRGLQREAQAEVQGQTLIVRRHCPRKRAIQ